MDVNPYAFLLAGPGIPLGLRNRMAMHGSCSRPPLLAVGQSKDRGARRQGAVATKWAGNQRLAQRRMAFQRLGPKLMPFSEKPRGSVFGFVELPR